MANLPRRKILEILSSSGVVTQRCNLTDLLDETVSRVDFNRLNHRINSYNFSPLEVLQDWFQIWTSYQGKNATLENLAKVLRGMNCNLEAGRKQIQLYRLQCTIIDGTAYNASTLNKD